jgi:hypothetical protein
MALGMAVGDQRPVHVEQGDPSEFSLQNAYRSRHFFSPPMASNPAPTRRARSIITLLASVWLSQSRRKVRQNHRTNFAAGLDNGLIPRVDRSGASEPSGTHQLSLFVMATINNHY